KMALEDLLPLKPDVLFLPDEPYEFTRADSAALAEVFRGEVVGPFPGHLFTWHGTRTVHGLEFLADWIGSSENGPAGSVRRRRERLE
ncbi:MAG: hypothetical protein R3338_13890, partial [Thermoanaerobaculia bacterium]|nr:hypothetical protein [Thermoanaerobaculia bacterium]